MAYWCRKPKTTVRLHSDQSSQYTSHDCRDYLKSLNIVPSMSRKGNCWDNAVAECFFANLKKERIRRKVYKTFDDAKADIFDYIEMFYNPIRRLTHNDRVAPWKHGNAFWLTRELCIIAALETTSLKICSKCSFTPSKLHFFAYFCLVFSSLATLCKALNSKCVH